MPPELSVSRIRYSPRCGTLCRRRSQPRTCAIKPERNLVRYATQSASRLLYKAGVFRKSFTITSRALFVPSNPSGTLALPLDHVYWKPCRSFRSLCQRPTPCPLRKCSALREEASQRIQTICECRRVRDLSCRVLWTCEACPSRCSPTRTPVLREIRMSSCRVRLQPRNSPFLEHPRRPL